jgi:hypothetical protein
MVFGATLQVTPQLPQLYGSFSGSMQVVPQHVRPLVHVPFAAHGPPPLSGNAASAPASEPPLDDPPDEPLELPPDEPPEPPLDDPLPPLLEDEPLLDPDPEPSDDPPEPDSADASELPPVKPDPPQARVVEIQTRDPPSHAYFK